MKQNTDEIKVTQSRLANFFGSLFPGLILFMLIDHKYGQQMFEIKPLTPAWYWGAVTLSFIAFCLLGRMFLFPKTKLLININGIEIGLGEYKREVLFIPWENVEGITKTEVRSPGRLTYNSATKKSEPVMLPGVQIALSEKHKECGFCPAVFVRGSSVFVTETLIGDTGFIEKFLHIKELEK
jgi:hypothetical protein